MSEYKKKLIEMALPLTMINEACVDDKDIKTGHIRGLHKWFAPMPLPAWRALIFASIVDDPGNTLTPKKALNERNRLFQIIERLMQKDAYKDRNLLNDVSEILKKYGADKTLILDPFCGGGSTILEAQRLGLNSFGSDLNPIPVLITTLLTNALPFVKGKKSISSNELDGLELEDSNSLEGIKADFKYYAERVSQIVKNDLENYFPKHSSGGEIFAWRWCWAVQSPHPAAKGAYTPLVTDWKLWKRQGSTTWIVPKVNLAEGKIDFQIRSGGSKIDPTVSRGNAKCLFTGRPIPLSYIRTEGKEGRLKPVLLAGVARAGSGQRHFVSPTPEFIEAAEIQYPTDAPGLEMPEKALGFRVQEYGINDFSRLYLPRQSLVLCKFSEAINNIREEIINDGIASGLKKTDLGLLENGEGVEAYADTVMLFLSLCLGKMAQANNILTRWVIDPRNGSAKAVQSFDRHAVPMVWDFVETNPFGGSVGDWLGPVLKTALLALKLNAAEGPRSQTKQVDARELPFELKGKCIIATDPPYYANIGYADLSDFFYIWHRKALRNSFPSLFRTIGTPKANELIASPFRHDGNRDQADTYFRQGFIEVFTKASEMQDPKFPLVVVYAYKQKKSSDEGIVGTGWEAMLEAIIKSNLSVVGTLPIRAVRKARMINIGTNSLASAVAIVCRKNPKKRQSATKREFVNKLKKEIPKAIERLTETGIAPVDLAQALIGPGMEIYCQYEKVIESDDAMLTVRSALEAINHVVIEVMTKQEGAFDSETRWCLTWFEENSFDKGDYGEANLLAQARNVTVEGLVAKGIVISKSGSVQLVSRNKLSDDGKQIVENYSAWLSTMALINILQEKGEVEAGLFLRLLGNKMSECKDLAYRCFAICESKGWSSEAVAFNGLILSWSELIKVAKDTHSYRAQGELEL